MATVRFSINPQDPVESVVIAAGAATVTKSIELTVDQAALVSDSNSATNPRAIKREEVVMALLTLIMAMQRDNTTLNV